MRKLNLLCIFVLLCGWLASQALADTYQLTSGQSITGDPVSMNEQGTLFSLPDGTYSDRVSWGKFSQADLKKIAAANPKAQQFVEPFMEPDDSAQKKAEEAAIDVKTDYPRLDRPAAEPFFKALGSTGIGVLALLVIYLANIYAGYEISIFRARSPGLVCGVAAVAPFLGPIIFLCMPTQMESKADIVQEPAREKEIYHAGEVPPEGEIVESSYVDDTPQLPATETFARGQYTFNRRFFETKFPGFFSVVRREDIRDMVLSFRANRGSYEAQRITRVSMNDLHIQIVKGHASEEVMIPFIEIQEVTLKHKDT